MTLSFAHSFEREKGALLRLSQLSVREMAVLIPSQRGVRV